MQTPLRDANSVKRCKLNVPPEIEKLADLFLLRMMEFLTPATYGSFCVCCWRFYQVYRVVCKTWK